MNKAEWRIYVGRIPYNEKGNFWVSFESDQCLKKTKENIYGRCLPCIQDPYHQSEEGHNEIILGNAYNCWKVTATVNGFEECLELLYKFERRFPGGNVYGKFGSGRINSGTKAVVFHTEDIAERDRIRKALEECLSEMDRKGEVQISRARAILYEEDILGDWKQWQPITPIKYPENVDRVLERIKKTIWWP